MKNKFDSIVVGSGIAGLTTALSFPDTSSVALVTKTKLSEGSTSLAQGGIAAVLQKDDSFSLHIRDTLRAGDSHNKKRAVSLLSKKSAEAIAWLSEMGVPFEKNENGEFLTTLEAAHSRRRILHASDFTGKAIETALIRHILKKKNITVMEHMFCTDLLVARNTCYGIQYLHQKKPGVLYASSVILATGGVGQIFQWTTNPTVSTADGMAIAKRAGAVLKDMEFIQFHPTAFRQNISPLFLLSEALRGEGAHIVNEKNERFLFQYVKDGELAPRDEVARAIFQEQKTSNVYLDMHHVAAKIIKKRFPNIFHTLKKHGLDLSKDLVPITPAAHYMCGGIATDLKGKTSIQNLYAVGEVACTGVHGANRLASNSLLEGVVFAKELVKGIENKKFSNKFPPISTNLHLRGGRTEMRKPRLTWRSPRRCSTNILANQLKQTMWNHVGIVRTQEDLKTAKDTVLALKEKIPDENTHFRALELRNMLEISLAIIEATIKRKKSLGTHYVI